jgi:hypothetical protein
MQQPPWKGAVAAALLLCHRCRSAEGVDDAPADVWSSSRPLPRGSGAHALATTRQRFVLWRKPLGRDARVTARGRADPQHRRARAHAPTWLPKCRRAGTAGWTLRLLPGTAGTRTTLSASAFSSRRTRHCRRRAAGCRVARCRASRRPPLASSVSPTCCRARMELADFVGAAAQTYECDSKAYRPLGFPSARTSS